MQNPLVLWLERIISWVKQIVTGVNEYIPSKLRLPILVVEIGVTSILVLPPSVFHSFSCETVSLATSYQATNNVYVDNQVIVLGVQEDVTRAVEPLGLTLIEGCNLSYLNTRPGSAPDLTEQQRKSLVLQLYQTPASLTVENAVTQINQVRINTPSRYVLADPNYLTRLLDSTIDPCARPSDSGSGGGHPFGTPGMADPEKTKAAFMQQWAFGPDGIDLVAFREAHPGLTGRGVRVGVFDTSPFRRKLPFFGKLRDGLSSPLWFTNWDVGGTTMMSSHGLFVAKLINGIAPKSRIHLIRVLNDDGCGDLWMLNTGLHDFISHMSFWTGKLDKTVINMSLGFKVVNNPEDNDTGLEQDAVGSTENDNQAEEETSDSEQDVPDGVSEDVETLKSLLKTADDLGAIMFAAAGNASEQSRREPMELPAADPKVYGVAATRMDGGPSCYTNKGEIAAPGGDVPNRGDPCEPNASNWNVEKAGHPAPCTEDNLANCPLGLISLVQTRYGPQYVLWSGTSFATPLVSGMAALGYESMRKETVICLIQGGGTTGTDPVLGTGPIKLGDLVNTTVVNNCP